MKASSQLSAQVYACALVGLLAPWLAGCTFSSQGLASDDLRSSDGAARDGAASEASLDGSGPPDQRRAEQAVPDGSPADHLLPTDLVSPAPDVACGGDAAAAREVCDGKDNNCNGQIDEGFSADCKDITCTGNGKLKTISDSCIDDYGSTRPGDSLEIYCCAGVARFCLSNEVCPWRAGCGTTTDVTCSRSGLSSNDGHLAKVRNGSGCMSQAFNGHADYYCDASGHIRF